MAEAEEAVDRELDATEDELRANLAEIIALTTLPGRKPGDVTVKDYVWGIRAAGGTISENAARNRLSRATEQGLLESEMVMDEGRRKRVYRKATQDEVKDGN